MTVVLDTSAAAEIVLNRLPGIHLQKFIVSAEKVYSTDLFKAEIANTLWKYTVPRQAKFPELKQTCR